MFRFPRQKAIMTRAELPRLGRLQEDQITIEVLHYRVSQPGAVVENGSTTIYSDAFKDFIIKRFERESETLTPRQFACAAELRAVTLRTWLAQSRGPLKAAMPAPARSKRGLASLFVDDKVDLWRSVLKENPQRRFTLGLVVAALLHFIGVSLYPYLHREEAQARTVSIAKYTEIVIPEIKEMAKPAGEETPTGRRPTGGIFGLNIKGVQAQAKKEEKNADASNEEAELKKTGVLAMIEDDLAVDIDQVFSTGGKSLSKGRGGQSANSSTDLTALLGELNAGNGGNSSIDKILKQDAASEPAFKLAKKTKIDVKPIEKVTGSQEAVGARNEQSLYKVLSQNTGRLQWIYEKFLKTNPDIRGKVEVEVTINPDGGIANVAILSSEIPIPDFQRQLIDAIRRWKYEAIAQGQMKVVYPIVFNKIN
ncbi:MAG: TonB family protein [bacterium]